jgi:hypothetical protein
VKDGLQYMQDGKVSRMHVQFTHRSVIDPTLQVSAQKLTYRISDTPAV